MSRPAAPDDPITALNDVLSEVIDVVQDVKQAHRKVSETHSLHAELDHLFADLGTWAQLLLEEDTRLGVSALGLMPSAAGRKPENRWPGEPSDDDVRRVVGEHLERLEEEVAAARAAQDDDRTRAALADVERGLLAHLNAFKA